MENASKALLITGAILIAMLTTSLLVYLSNNIKSLGNSEEEKKALEQLVEFNRGYEAYNKPLLYGADVITVYNKAAENNIKYNGTSVNYYIGVIIQKQDGTTMEIGDVKNNHKTNIFKCTGTEYSNITGRISKITFKYIPEPTTP